MPQRFHASPTDTFTWSNGAVGHRPGGPFDCLGPYAKVKNCPVEGNGRYTCYAQSYPDTYFTIPAATRIRGRYIRGFFSADSSGSLMFYPYKGQGLMEPAPGFKFCPACNGTGVISQAPTPLEANLMLRCKDCEGKGQVPLPGYPGTPLSQPENPPIKG